MIFCLAAITTGQILKAQAETMQTGRTFHLTELQETKFQLKKAEYQNLVLALELKRAETRAMIQTFKDEIGLGPEYEFNELTLEFIPGAGNAGN